MLPRPTLIIAGFVALVSLVVSGCDVIQQEPPDSNKVVSAYFPTWSAHDESFSITNMPASNTTHLIYAFARPQYDEASGSASVALHGNPTSDDEEARKEALAIAKTLERLKLLKAKHRDMKVLVSVGGWGLSKYFSDIAASEHARKTFTASCMELILEHGFDGIDIDWEFPVEGGSPDTIHRENDADNLLLLLRQLRTRFDLQSNLEGKPYFLTMAVAGEHRSHEHRYRLDESAAFVDWFHLMAYDFAGGWQPTTGHGAPLFDPEASGDVQLSVHGAVHSLLAHGVLRDQVVLGMNLSGRRYVGVERNQYGLHQPFRSVDMVGEIAGSNNYRRLARLIETSPSIEQRWDEEAHAAYLFDPEQQLFISFEDERSVATKATYAREHDLRGVMCWSLDKDDGKFSLLNTVQSAFLGEETRDLH